MIFIFEVAKGSFLVVDMEITELSVKSFKREIETALSNACLLLLWVEHTNFVLL